MDGLKRVAKVYGLVEQMRSAELKHTEAAVLEVQRADEVSRVRRQEQVSAGRAALLLGDREAWLVAELQRHGAEMQARRVEGVRLEREAMREAAAAAHRESRRSKLQVEEALNDSALREAVEAGRRVQAATDDRYGSRRAWMRGQEQMKAG